MPEARALICGAGPSARLPRPTKLGFWVALSAAKTYDPIDLWHIGYDGTASQLGTYPEPPPQADTKYAPVDSDGLDATGRFYEIVRNLDHQPYDLIVRRELNGVSEVIYDELDDPILRVHISSLVTGPSALDESKRHVWGGDVTTPYCPSRAELWTYTSPSSPPAPPPVPVPIPDPQPGPGVACGAARCTGADMVCCGPWPATSGAPSCKLTEENVDPNSLAKSCLFPAVYAACDQSSDCVTPNDDPKDPAVCCFTFGTEGASRVCTTARVCAGSASAPSSVNFVQYTGVLACQQDADCALAAQPSRCVNDGAITGSPVTYPQVGRCEGAIQAPDGTALLSSSVLCGASMCSRVERNSCCHTGALDGGNDYGLGVTTMEMPQCTSNCSSNDVSTRYAAHSYCDEPADCSDPAAADPADPFECCFVENPWGGPWHRECQKRSTCQLFACERQSDCDRVDPALTCRPERTLTGGGKKRPEVRSCQKP